MNKKELSRKRSVLKQERYYKNLINDINLSERKKANARLKKGLYKKLFEEFDVLLEFTKLKYGTGENIKFKWVGDEQQGKTINYDGEIYIDGKLVEKVEITCPLFSKRDIDIAKELNKDGCSSLEVYDLETILDENKIKVKDKALNKNGKTTYDNTITLVVYMEDYRCFNNENYQAKLDELKNELKNVSFQFKNVYLLTDTDGNLSLEQVC